MIKSSRPLSPIAASFQEASARLAEQYQSDRNADAYLLAHSHALDEAIKALCEREALPTEDLALIAVGGYGRNELFPFSDIDLLVLTADHVTEDTAFQEKIAAFVTALWEFGLSVGASVRNTTSFLEEALNDVSIATTYLESRHLWGSETLTQEAWQKFREKLNVADFYRNKMLELSRRHHHFEDSPYALEPNLKESPGGLRDLQVFLWCAEAAGLANNVEGMATAGLITEKEVHALKAAWWNLKQWRIALHLLTGRHEDRLIFDIQEELAKVLGYEATELMRASEAFMKRYYLNARSVVQLSVIQLQTLANKILGEVRAETTPTEDPAFVMHGDELDIVDDQVYTRDPSAILRTFYQYYHRTDTGRYATRLLRALWHAVPSIDQTFREDPANQAMFMQILTMPKGAYHALKDMNIWDVLGRFLPAFRPIVGQMQHDLYHIFTVDQHTLRVIRNIRRFARSEFAHEYPHCSHVMASVEKPWRIVIAGLFHDIGKGQGGHHDLIGAEKMAAFGKDFGFEQEDIDFMVFLVRYHLLMSQVAQRQDISDPAVVKRFVDTVKDKAHLDSLYLLTIADIRATSPKVWTPWKGQLIERLYHSAADMLSGNSSSTDEAMELRLNSARAKILEKDPAIDIDSFWKELDVVYFMRHSSEEIIWHTLELTPNLHTQTPIVKVQEASGKSGYVILLYMPDRQGLFLRAVAYLAKLGLSVVDTRVHTTRHGWALDTFLVADRFERYTLEELQKKLEPGLAAAVVSETPLPAPAQGKLSRRSQHFPLRPSVTLTPDERGNAWILYIVCTDRPGLLYGIFRVLYDYKINLQTAKIATLGERVEDVFLIDSPVLRDDATVIALEAKLLEVLTVAPKVKH